MERFLHTFKRPAVRDVLILSAFALLATIPFIGQAFHWDDRDFIEQAQVSAESPGDFHRSDYSSRGRFFPRFRFPHPPLLSYYLAFFVRTTGISESVFHGAYLVFPLIAAVSMYSLGRRFTRHPVAAAVLMLLTPGFMVMSHTIMGNAPGVSLWLAATALFIWGADRGDWRLLIASGGVTAAAIFTFAQALGLFPLLILYALLKRRFYWPVFASLLIPASAYALWRYYISARYGHPPAISYRAELRLDWQIRDIMTFIGGSIIFPVAAWIVFVRRRIDVLVAFLTVPPLVTWTAVYYMSRGELTLAQGLQVALMVTTGFLVAYGFLAAAARSLWHFYKGRKPDTDIFFLLGWFAVGIAPYFVSTLPFVAVRHLLPLFAPVILLFIREAGDLWPRWPRLRNAFLIGTIAITGLFALSASVADYRLAGLYRDQAAEMAAQFRDSPVKVWSLGEFDWRYYMEREGFEYLGVNSVASPGDLVLVSEICSRGVVAPLPEGFYEVLSVDEPEDGFPIRTMNPWAGAGFYGNLMGPVPVIPSLQKMDVITVNRLSW